VEAICRLADLVPTRQDAAASPGTSAAAPYRVVNIGGGRPIELEEFIATIERAVGRKANRTNLPMQPGDIRATHASTAVLEKLTGFLPRTTIAQGIEPFVAWYREYFRV